MEPAHTIIAKLGGHAQVSVITGTAYTAPYRWTYSRDRNGTGGTIPQRYHLILLDYAWAHGIDLRPGDFLPAREEHPCAPSSG